ncbi:MAG: PH domain-containing protein [Patescibacteria group bacterium]|jgi:hypothetical protein
MLIYKLLEKLPDEKIIKILRKDTFVLFVRFVLGVLLIGLPALAGYTTLNLYPNLLLGEISYPLILIAVSGYILFIWLFGFFTFIDYYLDIWIITNQRIIDVRQEGFFSRTVSELKIAKIQDVTSELKGFFQFIFRYGDVHVQTAAETQRFIFMQIPKPEQVRDIIIKLVEENKKINGVEKV